MMDGLESRMLFSTATTIVHVGPTEAVKTLDAVKWPAVGSTASLEVIVDYSATPYSVGHHGFGGNVTIVPANAAKPPTLKLQPTDYPTFYSNYKLLIKGIDTVGGSKIILAGTNTKGSVDVEDVNMLDGGARLAGTGRGQRLFQGQQRLRSTPYDYVYSNFTGIAQNVTIDNSDTNVPVQQGTRQAAIRMMDVDNFTMKHVITKPYLINGKVYKQDIQLRPSSKTMNIIDCTFDIADVGDMTWRSPAMPIESVVFTDDTMLQLPHITAGVKSLKLVNCLVAGKKVTKTLV